MKKQRRKGFSLMEVMAAVVVVAAVATATVSSLVALRAKSLSKIDEQNIADLNGKAQAYYMEFGVWPNANLSDLHTQGYTEAADQPTPFGGSYSFDAVSKKVVNTNAP